MPSQQVIDKLLETQKELDKIKTAVEHIKEAAEVAQKASRVILEVQKLIKELNSIEKEHRWELLKLLKEKVGEIEHRIENVVKELEISSKQFRQLVVDLSHLEKSISTYFEEIKKIDFPKRLDKIDNQISSINIGIQNLQGDVKRVQDKVEGGFKDINHYLTDGFSSINSNINLSTATVISSVGSHINTKVAEVVIHLESETEKVIASVTSHIDAKISDAIIRLELENELLKKEIKTSQIIQILAGVIVVGLLIYLVSKH